MYCDVTIRVRQMNLQYVAMSVSQKVRPRVPTKLKVVLLASRLDFLKHCLYVLKTGQNFKNRQNDEQFCSIFRCPKQSRFTQTNPRTGIYGNIALSPVTEMYYYTTIYHITITSQSNIETM